MHYYVDKSQVIHEDGTYEFTTETYKDYIFYPKSLPIGADTFSFFVKAHKSHKEAPSCFHVGLQAFAMMDIENNGELVGMDGEVFTYATKENSHHFA